MTNHDQSILTEKQLIAKKELLLNLKNEVQIAEAELKK